MATSACAAPSTDEPEPAHTPLPLTKRPRADRILLTKRPAERPVEASAANSAKSRAFASPPRQQRPPPGAAVMLSFAGQELVRRTWQTESEVQMWSMNPTRSKPQLQELPLACPDGIDIPAMCALLDHPRVKHEIFVDVDDTKRLFLKEPVRLGWIRKGDNEVVRRNRILPSEMLMIFPRGVTGLGRRRLVLHTHGRQLDGFPLEWPRMQPALRFPDEISAICGTSTSPRVLTLPAICRELGLAASPEGLVLERSGAMLKTPKGTVNVVRLPYYHQRVLFDEDGTTIWLGMDESRDRTTLFMVYTTPSTTTDLVRYAERIRCSPILRWRTIPPMWPYYLPLCDYPMANLDWLDLYVRPDGRAQLFRPQPGTTIARWNTMLQRLEHLWLDTLAKGGYKLLDLVGSKERLEGYYDEKYAILREYFEIREIHGQWSHQGAVEPADEPAGPAAGTE